MLYLVRHAKAGTRHDFGRRRRAAPLNKAGRAAVRWRSPAAWPSADSTALISSPYVRCVQTLEPLAHLLSAQPVEDRRPAGPRGSAVHRACSSCARSVPDGAVLCSHGDVIPEVDRSPGARGCELTSPPDWRKASTWVLRRDDDGKIVSARCWPPPDA